MSDKPRRTTGPGWEHPLFLWSAQFIGLFALWLALSGRFTAEFLVLGAVSAGVVAFLSQHLVLHPARAEKFAPVSTSFTWLIAATLRFLAYVPWLLYQIVAANVQVTYVILRPRLNISPRLVVFDTSLKTEPAQVLLANSITLTPGTITVDVNNGRFLVHALSVNFAEGLEEGAMQDRVARVLGEVSGDTQGMRTINHPSELDD
jgi:multicomponent Na+:H+ antiporter subunit E